jgi:hypothetical protein
VKDDKVSGRESPGLIHNETEADFNLAAPAAFPDRPPLRLDNAPALFHMPTSAGSFELKAPLIGEARRPESGTNPETSSLWECDECPSREELRADNLESCAANQMPGSVTGARLSGLTYRQPCTAAGRTRGPRSCRPRLCD